MYRHRYTNKLKKYFIKTYITLIFDWENLRYFIQGNIKDKISYDISRKSFQCNEIFPNAQHLNKIFYLKSYKVGISNWYIVEIINAD